MRQMYLQNEHVQVLVSHLTGLHSAFTVGRNVILFLTQRIRIDGFPHISSGRQRKKEIISALNREFGANVRRGMTTGHLKFKKDFLP